MADNMNWRYGDTQPVISSSVEDAAVIEIGDLVANIESASGTTWGGGLSQTQEAFHDGFLGVAAQRSRDGETDPIRVNTRGVHEFDCDASTFSVGQLVGPAQNGSAPQLANQKVVAVATENLAIGRVAKEYTSPTTKVLVEIVSTVMHGGPQAMA